MIRFWRQVTGCNLISVGRKSQIKSNNNQNKHSIATKSVLFIQSQGGGKLMRSVLHRFWKRTKLIGNWIPNWSAKKRMEQKSVWKCSNSNKIVGKKVSKKKKPTNNRTKKSITIAIRRDAIRNFQPKKEEQFYNALPANKWVSVSAFTHHIHDFDSHTCIRMCLLTVTFSHANFMLAVAAAAASTINNQLVHAFSVLASCFRPNQSHTLKLHYFFVFLIAILWSNSLWMRCAPLLEQ